MYEPTDFYLTAVDQPREAAEQDDMQGKVSSIPYKWSHIKLQHTCYCLLHVIFTCQKYIADR